MRLPKVKYTQFWDTRAQAAAYALPQSLGGCAEALHLIPKDETGKLAMMQLSKPRKPSKTNPNTRYLPETHPDKFQQLYDYCLNDIRVQQAIWRALPQLTTGERINYQLTFAANLRGLPIDADAVKAMLKVIEVETDNLVAECKQLTGVNARQVQELGNWLVSQGLELQQTDKGNWRLDKMFVERTLKRDDLTPNIRRALEIRQELSKSSTAKYNRMLSSRSADGTVKDNQTYHGARTGRSTGGALQVLNMPRPTVKKPELGIDLATRDPELVAMLYDQPMALASSAIRGMIKAPEGKTLVVADYSQIESRVICWLSGQQDALNEFASGLDPYLTMASVMYGIPYDQIRKDSQERQIAKSAVLGCGFGLGSKSFIQYCDNLDIQVTDEEAEFAVSAYRKKHHKIQQFWYDCEDAAVNACANPGEVYFAGKHICFRCGEQFLQMRLPSGRRLNYFEPELRDTVTPWGQKKKQITFMGVSTFTHQYERISTYSGDLSQSATQGTARDILMEAWRKVERDLDGHEVLLTVYDEILTMADESKADLDGLCSIMCDVPHWAAGLPIKAEGYIAQRYRK